MAGCLMAFGEMHNAWRMGCAVQGHCSDCHWLAGGDVPCALHRFAELCVGTVAIALSLHLKVPHALHCCTASFMT
eukprot:1161351-Pelagomonas_calceolata.AAC.1